MIEYAEGVEAGSVLARWLAEPMRATCPIWVHIGREAVIGLDLSAEISAPIPGLRPMLFEPSRVVETQLRRALEQRKKDLESGFEQSSRGTEIRGDTGRRFWNVTDARGRGIRCDLLDEDFGPWERLLAWPKTPRATVAKTDGTRERWVPTRSNVQASATGGGRCAAPTPYVKDMEIN